MPAKTGIQKYLKTLDSFLRGNDAKERFETFCETVKTDNINDSLFKFNIRCWAFDVRCSFVILEAKVT